AKAGEGDRLVQYVDFPAVWESFKSQLQAMLMKQMQREDLKDNPFAVIGMALAGSMANAMVDNLVTPESLANIVNSGRLNPSTIKMASPSDQANNSEIRKPPPNITHSYEGLGVFKVEMRDPGTDKLMVALVFNRDSWFSWKLKSVRLTGLTEN